jgi:GGDEF domain-containing protein
MKFLLIPYTFILKCKWVLRGYLIIIATPVIINKNPHYTWASLAPYLTNRLLGALTALYKQMRMRRSYKARDIKGRVGATGRCLSVARNLRATFLIFWEQAKTVSMRRMHYRVLLLVAWLLFLYALEPASRFVGPWRVDLLTAYAYVFVALVAFIGLALPAVHRLPLPLLISVGVLVFLVFKTWFGYPLWGRFLPLTVTEVCAFLVTGLLTRQVIWAIREFETSIVNFTIKHVGRHPKTFAIEQGEMYQEVRRAREFNRPLTLMSIEPETNSFKVAKEKMVEQVQRATTKQYVFAALAKTLEDQLSPYSIIAQNGDKFLVLIPETRAEDLPLLATQLGELVQESLGLGLRIGGASLPEVETFDELVETAHRELKNKARQKPGETLKPVVTSAQGQVPSQ